MGHISFNPQNFPRGKNIAFSLISKKTESLRSHMPWAAVFKLLDSADTKFTQVGTATLGMRGLPKGRKQSLPGLGLGTPTAVTQGASMSSITRCQRVGMGKRGWDWTLWFKVKVCFCSKTLLCSFAKSAS